MAHTIKTRNTALPAPHRFSFIQWLVNLDAAFRSKAKFDRLNDEALDDMGISRLQKNQAFFQQFMPRS